MESGTKLGPYAILEQLGAGGMGEVWLAEDTRLGRKVAIKVLPAEFASDPERLARFEQEARAAAALNHPHIAAVHDVGLEDGTHFMVQEYLQGKTLRDLLDAGPVPIEKALALGTEMAEALRAAHRAGIVHRDLKPENVFVTEDGHAKVLDFGLAKLTEVATGGMSSQSMSPTVLGTQAGSVMGTAGYMAPEQVQGEDVDHRADLFAFGCVLYELVSGARAFAGKSVPHTLHKILDEEPEGFEEASDTLPLRLRWLLQRCLAKTAEARAQSAGDVAVELQQIAREVESGTAVSASGQAPDHTPPAQARGGWSLGTAIPGAVVFIALGAALVMWLGGNTSETAELGSVRFTIGLPEGRSDFGNFNHRVLAVSPDGTLVAFVTDEGLWLRSLNDLELVPLRGTEEPRAPSFSPDSSQIAFWADDQIKRVGVTGGAPVVVGPSPGRPNGVSWATDGFIYVGDTDGSAIHRFAETGGQPEAVVHLTEDDGIGYGPRLLPGGEWLMFTLSMGGEWDTAQIVAQSLVTNARRVLVEGGHDARYSPTGHLLYVTGGVLLARRLDPQTLVVEGGAVPVLEGVRSSGRNVTGAAFYGLADAGTLIYIIGGDDFTTTYLGWIDLEGNIDPLPASPAAFGHLAVSPDGSRYAVEVSEGGGDQIWVYGVDRPSGQRLTTTVDNVLPVWSADGEWVYFASSRNDDNDIWRRRADLSGPEEEVLAADGPQEPSSVSQDGQWLYYTNGEGGLADIWRLALDGGGEPEPVVVTPAAEHSARIGPGGRYLAFVSNETGSNEAFVLDLEEGGRWNVSTAGASWPTWSAVRDELYYVWSDGMWLVEFTTDPDFEPAVARLAHTHPPQRLRSALALAPDGERTLARLRGDVTTASVEPHIDVVLNWFDELNARAPIER